MIRRYSPRPYTYSRQEDEDKDINKSTWNTYRDDTNEDQDKQTFWWPGWWNDADNFVKDLVSGNGERTQRTTYLLIVTVKPPVTPWNQITMNFSVPLN